MYNSGKLEIVEIYTQIVRQQEMALEIPTWLNLRFIEKILRSSEGDNSIHVIDMDTKPATNKGDNYATDLFRITAEFSRDQGGRKIIEKKSVIAKVAPTSGIRYEMITLSGFFQVEISMMLDTLDKMNELLGPKYRLSGKGLYAQNENPMLLMIEDLAPLGFRMADRACGLDLAHSILALHEMARFHAASVALCEKEPKQKDMYVKGFFSDQYPQVGDFFIMSTKALADEIANWPEVKKYSKKMAKLSDHIHQVGIDACKFSEDEFNVINHGEFHVNNMLFKYDKDGKPTDHILVDFQACLYNSPTIDLLNFFNSSLSPNVIENKRGILLNEYLGTLSATMKQLNCKTQPPTMEELKSALKRRFSYGMIVSFSFLPLMLCPKAEAKNLDEVMGTDTFVSPGLKTEIFKKLMLKRLPLYDELGLLDL